MNTILERVMCRLEAAELRIQALELELSDIPGDWVWDGDRWVAPGEYSRRRDG